MDKPTLITAGKQIVAKYVNTDFHRRFVSEYQHAMPEIEFPDDTLVVIAQRVAYDKIPVDSVKSFSDYATQILRRHPYITMPIPNDIDYNKISQKYFMDNLMNERCYWLLKQHYDDAYWRVESAKVVAHVHTVISDLLNPEVRETELSRPGGVKDSDAVEAVPTAPRMSVADVPAVHEIGLINAS